MILQSEVKILKHILCIQTNLKGFTFFDWSFTIGAGQVFRFRNRES